MELKLRRSTSATKQYFFQQVATFWRLMNEIIFPCTFDEMELGFWTSWIYTGATTALSSLDNSFCHGLVAPGSPILLSLSAKGVKETLSSLNFKFITVQDKLILANKIIPNPD